MRKVYEYGFKIAQFISLLLGIMLAIAMGAIFLSDTIGIVNTFIILTASASVTATVFISIEILFTDKMESYD